MSATVIYNLRAAEGKAEELLTLLRRGREFAASVDGFEAFDLYQGEHDPQRLVTVET